MKGKSTYTYYDHGCCMECFIYFYEDRPDRIKARKEGWKPSPEDLARKEAAFKDVD
jgi:hypothetical protein